MQIPRSSLYDPSSFSWISGRNHNKALPTELVLQEGAISLIAIQANNPSQDRQFPVLKGQDCAPFKRTVPDSKSRNRLRDKHFM
jgi:hypothetical protein